MPFENGRSGNPNGRPPKKRALTDILEKAGSTKQGTLTAKKKLATLLWEGATTGVVTFDDAPRVLSADEWLSLSKFIYQHIDGAPKNELDVTTNGNDLPGAGVVVVLPDNGRQDRD